LTGRSSTTVGQMSAFVPDRGITSLARRRRSPYVLRLIRAPRSEVRQQMILLTNTPDDPDQAAEDMTRLRGLGA